MCLEDTAAVNKFLFARFHPDHVPIPYLVWQWVRLQYLPLAPSLRVDGMSKSVDTVSGRLRIQLWVVLSGGLSLSLI